MDQAGKTRTIVIDLPIDSYKQVENLAAALEITLAKAGALTIFAGQLVQRAMDEGMVQLQDIESEENAV
ncbi:MAG: hypothetical protein ACOVQU_07100 [Exiguobacterium acetylicum]